MTFDASFWACMGFILFIAGIGKVAWQMLTTSLDERASKIKQDIEEATRLHTEAQNFLALTKRQQAAAAHEAQEILAHAAEEAERLKKQAIADMQDFTQTEERLLLERMKLVEMQALEAIRAKAIDVALNTAERMLQQTINSKHQEEIFQNILREIQDKPLYKVN